MNIYEQSEPQIRIVNELKQLPLTNLYYIVVQQSIFHSNLTLPELKKYIKRSVREYVKRNSLLPYYEGKENHEIKYYCVFETTKDFFLSQNTYDIVDEVFYSGFHFHLFIAGVNAEYINDLYFQLNLQKNKRNCISKLDCFSVLNLEQDFVEYHTKQFQSYYSPQLILKNY